MKDKINIKIIKENYEKLFSGYKDNIPVIYSSLEGQYNGELYVDNEVESEYAILVTLFDFSFIAGNPNQKVLQSKFINYCLMNY